MKKIRQFIIDVTKIFLNEHDLQKDLNEQADKVVEILTNTFDVNQQSEIVKLIKTKLIEKRKQDIVKAEENVLMLQNDLDKMTKNQTTQ